MTNEIKCPNCGHQFEPNEAIRQEVEKELKLKVKDWQIKKDEEFNVRLAQEKKTLQLSLEENIRKMVSSDYENQLKFLQTANAENEEKLKESRQKELAFLQKEKQLRDKEAELELTLQKKLQEERSVLSEQIKKQEIEKSALKDNEHMLKVQEYEKKLEDQKKLIEEMRRKSEQGSMQLQGEAQELLLEKILRDNFPFDTIEEVGKGVEGADCMQIVRNSLGNDCGKIIYESKRTKGWNDKWLEKLKTDKRNRGADVAILVTQTYPKGMSCFGERDGIWVCSFDEVSSVSCVIRHGVIKVYEAQKQEENKGDKMQLLYNYLTGVEFRGQVEAIAEGFMSLRNGITKERMQMEKIWKEREKQLEKVLISTSGMYGSVKGIAGASITDIPLLDGGDTNHLEE